MAPRTFSLFLDESGRFEDSAETAQPCSLVGGVFSAAGRPFTESWAETTLIDSFAAANIPWTGQVHGTQLKRDYGEQYWTMIGYLMQQLHNNGLQPIVFENKYRLKIVDNQITYLHVMADGLTQLLEMHDRPGETVTFRVLAARRMDDQGINEIPRGDYLARVSEHLQLEWVRRGKYEAHKRWELEEFEIGSARRDPRLQIADLVCNAWFRLEQRESLRQHYEPLTFTVCEIGIEQRISALLAAGSVGQAIFEWLSANSQKYLDRPAGRRSQLHLQETVAALPHTWQCRHLELVADLLDSTIHMEHALNTGISMAQGLLRFLDELSAAGGQDHLVARFRTHRLLLSALNHKGQVAASSAEIIKLRQLYPAMLQGLEQVDEVLGSMIREAVHLCNCYDFTAAVTLLDRVIRMLTGMSELLPCLLEEGTIGRRMRSELLGQALGTRMQAYVFLSRRNPEFYPLAATDSDQAVQEFSSPNDLARQALYRCQLECDRGDMEAALSSLLSACHADDIPGMARQIAADQSISGYFALAHFTRLMAAADSRLGEAMSNAWGLAFLESHSALQQAYHPTELICWKRGTYLLQNDSLNGLDWHRRALTICFRDGGDITLQTIGLAILADQCRLLGNRPRLQKESHFELVKQLRRLRERPDTPASVLEYFAEWDLLNERPTTTLSAADYQRLMWTVPY